MILFSYNRDLPMPEPDFSKDFLTRITKKRSFQVVPADAEVVPPVDLIWPQVMEIYSQAVIGMRTVMPNSSPQVQSDVALALAVFGTYEIYQSQVGTPPWEQSTVLTNVVANNVSNIVQLKPSPPSTDDAALIQWVSEQMPDFSEADLFPQGKDSLGVYLLWGMACRQLLTAGGWDVSGITASTDRPTLYVNGRFLYDRKGNQIVLRGVDYPLLDDWNFPANPVGYLNEIAKSGANAIRIQWYINYPDAGRPAYPMTALGTFLDSCIALNIIPIVMVADETCQNDVTLINSTVVPWWTHADTDPAKDVVDTLKARAQCLILNLANELGVYHWADNPGTALDTYIDAYQTAIKSMRTAGLYMPLMIDAPDCGTALDAFTARGADLIETLPLGNILLSAHAYWAGYDGRPFIPTAVASNLPIVFGEIANKQDETANDGSTLYCYYDLDGTKQNHAPSTGFTYQSFLETLLSDDIGWLAWSWTNDNCGPRQISGNGSFSALTTYGKDIVNNPAYGLKSTAVRITG
jgi:mannan endo-1,4-beta-mannosidase